MKIIITIVLIAAGAVTSAQAPPGTTLAEKIAQKMKDTLGLNTDQRQQLYLINMQLHNSKTIARTQHAGSDSVRIYLQRIENTRDSLYRTVLNEDKYALYRQKKSTLISGN